MKTEEATRRVIALARAIRSYWDAELPKRHPNYPLIDPDADSGPPPPEEKQLRQFLARLSEDTVYKLALILGLGRGDFDASDLPGRFRALKDDFGGTGALITQLVENASVADDLQEGLEMLRTRQLNLDKMNLTTASAGS